MAIKKQIKEIDEEIKYWAERPASSNFGKWWNTLKIEQLQKKKNSLLKKLKK